ncbi:hypothetical protein BDZ89DRAFT_1041342 [Hymenopellis radicata]|nr:hypothetical protein BDZ89DRAFT_1041342 [Hymenopellis radicata]
MAAPGGATSPRSDGFRNGEILSGWDSHDAIFCVRPEAQISPASPSSLVFGWTIPLASRDDEPAGSVVTERCKREGVGWREYDECLHTIEATLSLRHSYFDVGLHIFLTSRHLGSNDDDIAWSWYRSSTLSLDWYLIYTGFDLPSLISLSLTALRKRAPQSQYPIVGHEGDVTGFHSAMTRVPSANLGVAAFTNDDTYGPYFIQVIKYRIMNKLPGLNVTGWNSIYKQTVVDAYTASLAVT